MAYTITPFTGFSGSLVSTITVSNVIVPAGARLFAACAWPDTSVASMTCVYNGSETVGLLFDDLAGTGEMATFELRNPTAGTHNVVFSWTNAAFAAGYVLVVSGTSNAAAGNTVTGSATNNAPTGTVSSATGRLVIGSIFFKVSTTTISSDGSGCTRVGEITSGSGASHVRLWAEWKAGAASTVVSAGLSGSTTWRARGFDMTPAPSGSPKGSLSLLSVGR